MDTVGELALFGPGQILAVMVKCIGFDEKTTSPEFFFIFKIFLKKSS